MHSSSTLLWAALAATGLADSHYFFSGFFAGSSLVGVEFDDAASTLSLVHNMTLNTTAGSKWIAIDVSVHQRDRSNSIADICVCLGTEEKCVCRYYRLLPKLCYH